MLFATVRQRKIYVKNPTTVIRNGVNVDWLTLDMDEEWAQMDSIVCVFANGSVSVEQLYTYGTSVLVPWECLQETGFLTVSITGYVQDEKVMTTMNPDSGWNVVQNGTMTGSAPLEPTPSLYEQILAATGNATSAAKIANEAAEAATAATEVLQTATETILAAALSARQSELNAQEYMDAAGNSSVKAAESAKRAEDAAASIESVVGDIDSALDGIIALQNSYIGGDA